MLFIEELDSQLKHLNRIDELQLSTGDQGSGDGTVHCRSGKNVSPIAELWSRFNKFTK